MNSISAVYTFDPAAENCGDQAWTILCDFDGTISKKDVTDALLNRFGMHGYEELEASWENGTIGSRLCLEGQIALLDMNEADLTTLLDDIEIDPWFPAFVQLARKLSIPVIIVSDGLDRAIHHILKRHGLDDLPVHANHLVQVADRRWQLEFPHFSAGCTKASAHCKCASSTQFRAGDRKILFIGDGSSDFCASAKADYVLAKSRLVDFCRDNNIDHSVMNNFRQAIHHLEEVFTDANAVSIPA